MLPMHDRRVLRESRVNDEQLLERIVSRGAGRLGLGATLLERFGGLRGVLHASREELLALRGVGPAAADAILSLSPIARRYFECALPAGHSIRSPADTAAFLKAKLSHLQHETFCCLYLDNRHRVLEFDELFRGTIDGTSVYPREVVKEALAINAAAVIVAHNHPSGVAEPSQADERITRRLKAALELVDIRLLDHLVVGDAVTVSLASRGLL